jgi:hypothetical protein
MRNTIERGFHWALDIPKNALASGIRGVSGWTRRSIASILAKTARGTVKTGWNIIRNIPLPGPKL